MKERPNSAAKWIISLVRPDFLLVWTQLLWLSTVAGLWYWRDIWLPDWLGNQNVFIKSAIYFAGATVVYIVALVVAAKVLGSIDFAINPAYAPERAQRRKVQKFKIGDRVRVVGGGIRGNIISVDPTGEAFSVMWDDGHKITLSHSAVENLEPSY